MKSKFPLLLALAFFAAAAVSVTAAPTEPSGSCCGTPKVAPSESAPAYPPGVCVVSGEGLDSMGGPVDYVHQEAGKSDRLVRFCCGSCIKAFKKDPAKFLAQIDRAATQVAAASSCTREVESTKSACH